MIYSHMELFLRSFTEVVKLPSSRCLCLKIALYFRGLGVMAAAKVNMGRKRGKQNPFP